jgi:hypothetical protein
LTGSTGWKFAEYVACAKAIVSEPLGDRLPGDFAAGRNYLPFTTPDECATRVEALLSQPRSRFAMMRDNLSYYAAYGKPEMIVLNSLNAVLNLNGLNPLRIATRIPISNLG